MDRLLPIRKGMGLVSGIRAISERYGEVQGLFERTRKEPMTPPMEVRVAFTLCENLFNRVNKGDLRYRESELRAMHDLAEWTLQMVKWLRQPQIPKDNVWRSKRGWD